MSSAIEVLKGWKNKMANKVNIAFTPEEFDALGEALLALEKLDRLKKWLNKKYTENWFVLTNNKNLEEARIIRNFIKEVREVLEK